jgi:hypothetical protein
VLKAAAVFVVHFKVLKDLFRDEISVNEIGIAM